MLGKIAARRLADSAAFALVMAGACSLGGCKVLTIDEDRALRARHSANFDAAQYVDAIWASRVMPAIKGKATPVPTLIAAMQGGLDKAGAALGRRAGEGSAWTFVLRGEGVVTKVDDTAPRGGVDVALWGDAAHRAIRLQTGPVVSGSAIRDALPFVTFNDFADQLAFADVGRALTARSLSELKPVLGGLRPGSRIRFVGVANIGEAADPLVATPVSIASDAVSAGS